MDISEQIQALKDKLKKLPAEIEREELSPPSTAEITAKVKSLFPDFPESLFSFYNKHDGLKFHWYFENDNDVFAGKINISSLEYLMGGNTESWDENAFEDIIWSDDEDETTAKTIELRKKLKIFDNNSGQQIFVLVDISNGNLYLMHNRNLYELQISISEYFTHVFNFYGITYWQYLFTDNSDSALAKRCKDQLASLDIN